VLVADRSRGCNHYPHSLPLLRRWANEQVLQLGGGEHACEPGQPLRYNKENLLNPHFVVYGKVRDQRIDDTLHSSRGFVTSFFLKIHMFLNLRRRASHTGAYCE